VTKDSPTNYIPKYIIFIVTAVKKDEVPGELRKVHNDELSDLYSSPNIFGVIKSRKISM
jgi:hypothetical protein